MGTFVDIQSQNTDQNHEESLDRKRKQPKTTSAPKNQVKSRDSRSFQTKWSRGCANSEEKTKN